MLKFKPRRNPRGWLVDWIGVFYLDEHAVFGRLRVMWVTGDGE
jgi:hypothetical protein